MRTEIDRFLTVKKAENASPNTIRAYRRDLVELERFVGSSTDASQLTRMIVRAFLELLRRKGASKPTIMRKLYAIKSFTRWLTGEGIVDDDVCDGITGLKGPKLPNLLPDVPSVQEMVRLLDGDFPTAFPERDRLLCELLYSGLRVSEAAHLNPGDFRPEQDAIVVRGKGGMFGKAGKFRLVPLYPSARAAWEQYLPVREKMLSKLNRRCLTMFFGLSNNCDGKSISVRSIFRMLRFMTKIRGLQEMHPHLLRHACATHLLDGKCPLDVIAEVLGQDNLDVTAHYAQVSTRLMMESYNGAHPHAKG